MLVWKPTSYQRGGDDGRHLLSDVRVGVRIVKAEVPVQPVECPSRRKYFDMLPSRKAKPLCDYLRTMPDKERVDVVAMDFLQGFMTAVGRHMSGDHPQLVRPAVLGWRASLTRATTILATTTRSPRNLRR